MYSIPMKPGKPHKGRGTASNPAGRFEPYRREAEHDGWDLEDEPDPAPATVLLPDRAKTVITRNDSPDIPFDYSVNVYRGCEHGCPYCLSGDTRILMADGRHKALEDIEVGDRIIGTQRQGWYRRFVETEVRAHWQTTKRAYRITLEDGTSIVASGDHRFLTERGWKYVTGSEQGTERRPHLTPNTKLMGLGNFTDIAITRKRRISGIALKSQNRLGVRAIEELGFAMPMFDITSGTGDFIANGVVAHNCYARPSHSYLGLSPGLDFETRIFYKPDVARRLETELAKPGYVCKPINLGANTDPYQPAEKNLRVTRSVLEVLARCRHPVTLVTKSAMVRRDLDLLADLARDNLASVAVSLTSLDSNLKRTLEPRTAGPRARLKTMQRLHEAGVPVTALVAPVIPAINEPELEDLVAAAADHGATRTGYVLLRLPHEVKDLFREWLDTHHPLRAEHVMSLIRQSRGGRDNDPRFGHRMRGQGPFAELIRKRFHAACRRHGLNREPMAELDTSLFRPPELHGQQRLL